MSTLTLVSDSTSATRPGSRTKVLPVNAPREFHLHELFFSTTTAKGIILSGNDVFTRVSAYAEDEMFGKAHSLVRHPDMPRSVFRLFWDHLLNKRPIAAYVKNMAKDGRYYWVIALAGPIEAGYLSVRFRPSSRLFAIVEGLYKDVLAAETAQDEQGADLRQVLAAGEARLADGLRANGFASYDAFMRTALYEELSARDAALARDHRSVLSTLAARGREEDRLAGALRTLHQQSRASYDQVTALYAQLDACARLNTQLSAQARTILELTSAFHLVSLNIAIKSTKLGDAGRALGVIATHLGEASESVAGIVASLEKQVDRVSNWLGETVFSLAWARLQFEMTIVYYEEMLRHAADAEKAARRPMQLENIQALRSAFLQTIDQARKAIAQLAKDLNGLSANADDLQKAMLSLQVAHVSGLVEARRLTEEDGFTAFFEDVRQHIDGTKAQLVSFADVINDLAGLARQAPAIIGTVTRVGDRMKASEQEICAAMATDAANAAANPAA